jgi:hypothetical protein
MQAAVTRNKIRGSVSYLWHPAAEDRYSESYRLKGLQCLRLIQAGGCLCVASHRLHPPTACGGGECKTPDIKLGGRIIKLLFEEDARDGGRCICNLHREEYVSHPAQPGNIAESLQCLFSGPSESRAASVEQ